MRKKDSLNSVDIVILYTTEALTFKSVLDNLHKPEFKCMEWSRIERFSMDDKNLGWIWFYELYGKWEIEAKNKLNHGYRFRGKLSSQTPLQMENMKFQSSV